MEIYLLEQDLNNDYDTYDSMVVIAENKEEAINIHPSEFVTHKKDGSWMGTYTAGGEYKQDACGWVEFNRINEIKVMHIGTATDQQEKGVLLASFNAG